VAGTAVLLRAATLSEVGQFDEGYFLYGEDLDWCHRARAAGWEVWIDPSAVADHQRSSSVNVAGSWVDEHRLGSLDRYVRRHCGPLATSVIRLLRVVGAAGRFVLFGIIGTITRDEGVRRRSRRRGRDARLAARLLLRRP
jgi:GT2 family glycosyltransferase